MGEILRKNYSCALKIKNLAKCISLLIYAPTFLLLLNRDKQIRNHLKRSCHLNWCTFVHSFPVRWRLLASLPWPVLQSSWPPRSSSPLNNKLKKRFNNNNYECKPVKSRLLLVFFAVNSELSSVPEPLPGSGDLVPYNYMIGSKSP